MSIPEKKSFSKSNGRVIFHIIFFLSHLDWNGFQDYSIYRNLKTALFERFLDLLIFDSIWTDTGLDTNLDTVLNIGLLIA